MPIQHYFHSNHLFLTKKSLKKNQFFQFYSKLIKQILIQFTLTVAHNSMLNSRARAGMQMKLFKLV